MFDPNKSLWKHPTAYDEMFSDEWKAQCLNDYYQSIANDVAELEAALEEVALSDEIDNRMAELMQILADAKTGAALWYLSAYGQTSEAISTLKTNSTEFYLIVKRWMTENPAGIEYYNDNILPDFPGIRIDDLAMQLAQDQDDQIMYDWSDIQTVISNEATRVMNSKGLKDSYISFTAGNIKMKDLIIRYATEVNLNLPNIEGYKAWGLKDETGELLSIDDAISKGWNIDAMKAELSALGASMSLWGNAMVACVKDNISERVSLIESKAQDLLTTVKDKYGEAKDKFNLMKTKITQVVSDARTTLSNITDTLTTLFAAEDSYSTGETLADSDLARYTGINPTTAFRIKGVGKVLGATVYVCYQAGKAVWNVIKTVAHKLFVKVRPWINAVLGTPEDLKICDNDALSYETDLFCYNRELIERDLEFHDQQSAKNWADRLSEYEGKWIRCTTLFATTLIKFNNVAWFENYPKHVIVNFDYRMKPKCVNSDTIAKFGLGLPQWYGVDSPYHSYTRLTDIDDIFAAIADAKASSKFYADNDFQESAFQAGFATSMFLQQELMLATAADMGRLRVDISPAQSWFSECPTKFHYEDLNSDYDNEVSLNHDMVRYATRRHDDQGNYYKLIPYLDEWQGESWQSYNLTNKVFIQTVSGCAAIQGTGYSYDSFPPINPNTRNITKVHDHVNDTDVYTEVTVTDALITPTMIVLGNIIVNNETYYIQDQEDPEFLPYSLLTNDFDSPRFQIRTDEENIKMATTIAGVLVTVAIIAVAFFVTKGTISALKTKKYAKLKAKVGTMDNAMWQGKLQMNGVQTKFYKKWNRKLDKMGNCGVATASDTASAVSKVITTISETPALISNGTSATSTQAAPSDKVYDVDKYSNDLFRSITGNNLTMDLN